MSDNLNLINAKNTIDDEWYTPYEAIENGIIQGARTACIRKGKLKTWTGPTINQKTLFCRIIIRLKPGDDNV